MSELLVDSLPSGAIELTFIDVRAYELGQSTEGLTESVVALLWEIPHVGRTPAAFDAEVGRRADLDEGWKARLFRDDLQIQTRGGGRPGVRRFRILRKPGPP